VLKYSKSNNELLSKIERITKIGIFQMDLTTGSWTGSENFINIFGLPHKDQFTREEFQRILHPEDYHAVKNYFLDCLRQKKDFSYEYRCIGPNGKTIHVNNRSRISYDDDGTPLQLIGVKQDITEHKQFELKLSQLNKLIQKKDRVLGEVAHDLRAPVAQIMMIANILEEELHGETQNMFSLLQETCSTTESIISELIEIAELEDFNTELKKSVLDLNSIIEQSINNYKFKLKEKRLELKTSFSSNVRVYVDEKKILRVVDNLLSNAIKFTPENKSILISTKSDGETVQLIVEDEGIGIKDDHIPLLFDPYSSPIRRHGTNGEHSTGLGLNIIKQIIDLHKGNIEVESKLDQGTSFTVSLKHNLPDG